MKKHKFSNGDGMSLESSTTQERRIIANELVKRGYDNFGMIDISDRQNIVLYNNHFIALYDDEKIKDDLTNPLTYIEFLNKLNGESHTCHIQTNDLPEVVKNDFVFLNAIAEDSGRYLYECLEDARKDLKTLFVVLAGMIDEDQWERLSWKKDEIDCGNFKIYLIDEKFA